MFYEEIEERHDVSETLTDYFIIPFVAIYR